MHRALFIFILMGTAIACSCSALAQQKSREPKIVIAPKRPRPTAPPRPGEGAIFLGVNGFGSTCKASRDAKSPFFNPYKTATIADVMGAPIAKITITSYGDGWKKDDAIRARVLQVLSVETNDFAPGIEWDESAFVDLVGTIQFADGKEGAFEESAGHVCFNDHNGAAIFTRVQLKAAQ
jgi:hypothetical protein